jgi:uncharacterized protein
MLVGGSLGLLGSGGSILTVPILVFLLGHQEKIAIPESLAIVASIAAVGAVSSMFVKQVHWRSVVWFGLPSMAGAFVGAWASQWLSGAAQMLVFSALLLPAAYRMLSPKELQPRMCRPFCLSGAGLIVGSLSGLVGVGGGFLAVPALMLLGGLSLRLATGTSLVVIALSSAIGFAKHLHLLDLAGQTVDWTIVGLFVAIGVVASAGGQWLATRVSPSGMRRVFGVFLLCMTAFTVVGTLWR